MASTKAKRGRPEGKTMIPGAVMATFQISFTEKRKLERFASNEGKSFSQLLRELCKAEIERQKLKPS